MKKDKKSYSIKNSKSSKTQISKLNETYETNESNSTNFLSKGFSSTIDRFNINKNTLYNNSETPGPGTYNFQSTFLKTFKSFSSKGYLNGFLSKENRFNNIEEKLYYEKFKPGPCDYELNKIYSLYDNIKKSLFGKSLYNKKSYSIKNLSEEKKPEPCTYNPVKLNSESYKQDNLFNSKITRFKIIYNNNPGPGSYFNNRKIIKYFKSESPVFKKPIKKRIDKLKELNIKTDNDIIKEFLDNKINKSHNDDNINSHFKKSKIKNGHFRKNNSTKLIVTNIKFDLGEKIDTNNQKPFEFTYEIPKEEIMKLSSPRWKKKKYEFKVPGPAYYHIKNIEKHLSFNRNEKIYNISPGILYKYNN